MGVVAAPPAQTKWIAPNSRSLLRGREKPELAETRMCDFTSEAPEIHHGLEQDIIIWQNLWTSMSEHCSVSSQRETKTEAAHWFLPPAWS